MNCYFHVPGKYPGGIVERSLIIFVQRILCVSNDAVEEIDMNMTHKRFFSLIKHLVNVFVNCFIASLVEVYQPSIY